MDFDVNHKSNSHSEEKQENRLSVIHVNVEIEKVPRE